MRPINGNRSLLVVDDDAEVRRIVTILCETQGYEVVGEAANGIDAEMLAMTHKPHFVVLDYMMPFMDGAKTGKAIRRVSPNSRILALSAVIEELPDWADAFLPKTRIDDIAEALDRLMGEGAPLA